MMRVVWFFMIVLRVFCIKCLFFVFSVLVVLFKRRIGVFCRMDFVIVRCCFCLLESVSVCFLRCVL